jgi:hypothetical protein
MTIRSPLGTPARLDAMGTDDADRAGRDGGSRFADSEALRRVLLRLHAGGAQAWRSDPEADELARYAAGRFAALAVKHGLDAADGGSAAFEAMRNPGVVAARDPWGAIVRAVNVTLAAAGFAEEALCSVETARRGGLSGRRVERFADREDYPWDNHPALAVLDPDPDSDDGGDGGAPRDGGGGRGWPGGLGIADQARELAWWLAGFGWPAEEAMTGCEIALHRLADAGSRPAAYESLRRDRRARAIAGLPGRSWTALLRLLYGRPGAARGLGPVGRGALLRLALGETLDAIGADPAVAAEARRAAPRGEGGV